MPDPSGVFTQDADRVRAAAEQVSGIEQQLQSGGCRDRVHVLFGLDDGASMGVVEGRDAEAAGEVDELVELIGGAPDFFAHLRPP